MARASPIPATSEKALRRALRASADPRRALNYRRFFKTGPGQYGEGDQFLGVKVPAIRQLAGPGATLTIDTLARFLRSKWHEERMLALLALVERFRRARDAERERIYRAYLASTRYINNWDLVDATAEHIVGAWHWDRDRRPLRRMTRSKSLWERRIAIIATFHFIKRGAPDETLRLARALLGDEHDLIHKAVGWMLREVGKRCDRTLLLGFLDAHHARMPRTMLRYAIEHLPQPQRKHYLMTPARNVRGPSRKIATRKPPTTPSRKPRAADQRRRAAIR